MRQTSQPSAAEKKEAMKQAFKASSRSNRDTQSVKAEKAEKTDISSKKPTSTSSLRSERRSREERIAAMATPSTTASSSRTKLTGEWDSQPSPEKVEVDPRKAQCASMRTYKKLKYPIGGYRTPAFYLFLSFSDCSHWSFLMIFSQKL